MEEQLKKFLDKSQLSDDVEVLKDLIVLIAQMSLEILSDSSKQLQVASENMEYLKSELAVLKRFQFGQRLDSTKTPAQSQQKRNSPGD